MSKKICGECDGTGVYYNKPLNIEYICNSCSNVAYRYTEIDNNGIEIVKDIGDSDFMKNLEAL